MANIIGEPFDKKVKQQIEIRQEKNNALNKTTDVIKWQNNTNAFLRLASSVNLSGSVLSNIQKSITDPNLDAEGS